MNKELAKEPQELVQDSQKLVKELAQDVPDINIGDLISRKKLIEDIQIIAKELNKDKQNAESDDSDLMLAVDNQLSAIWRIKGVINNQPQVQLINTDSIIKQIEEQTSFLKDCTKYGNKDSEQQHKSYSTMMMYEVTDLVDDLIEIVRRNGEKEV